MKITNLVINITDISDALTLGENPIVESILSTAIDVVKNKGKITIQREYTNAEPDILAVYTSEEELLNWKNNLNNKQNILKRN